MSTGKTPKRIKQTVKRNSYKKNFSFISNVQICKKWKYWTWIKEIRAISINAMPMTIRDWFRKRDLLSRRASGEKPAGPEKALMEIQV